MHTPYPQLLVDDARRFGERLPAVAPLLGRRAPEPVTARIGRGLLAYAEHAMTTVSHLRENLLDRIAERTCPWWLRPVPSGTVVAFEPANGFTVPAHTPLTSRTIDGVACEFRTMREVRIGAYRVSQAFVSAPPGRPAIVSVDIEANGAIAEAFDDGEVSLYFGGDRETALALVHALTTAAARASWQSAAWDEPLELPIECVTRPGFDATEALAPDPDGLPAPFGIVTESSTFPDKFRFVRIGGLAALRNRPATSTATLTIMLSGVASFDSGKLDVRAHCVPVANLFDATSEPIALDFLRRPEHLRVSGLSARHGGIYAVQEVYATSPTRGTTVRLPDRRRHTANVVDANAPATFAITRDDDSLRIHFSPRADAAGAHVVSACVLATNRRYAAELRAGDVTGQLSTDAGIVRYVSVAAASPYVERPAGLDFVRRVLTESAIRSDPRGPCTSLRRALATSFPSWTLTDERAVTFQEQIDGISNVTVRLARRTTRTRAVQSGYRYELTMDETRFLGPGERGLFETAIAEALTRCLPLSTYLELVIAQAKAGDSTTYTRGVLA